MGVDHTRPPFRFGGRDMRLTDGGGGGGGGGWGGGGGGARPWRVLCDRVMWLIRSRNRNRNRI